MRPKTPMVTEPYRPPRRITVMLRLRGQRIEPVEVEKHLLEIFNDEVQKAVVDLTFVASNQEKPRLTAFVILRSPYCNAGRLEDLRHRISVKLSHVLPSYMVPTHVVVVEAFPQTVSGKINRRKLRSIESDILVKEVTDANHQELPNEHTMKLRRVWAEVLGVSEDGISEDTSWSELGGDSLTAISLSQKARKRGFGLNVADILQYPTLRQLVFKSRMVVPKTYSRYVRDDKQPAAESSHATTSFQKYTLDMSAGSHHSLVLYYLITIRGTVHVDLQRAAWTIFKRYDSLRVRFDRSTTVSCEFTQTVYRVDDPEVLRRVKVVRCVDADQEMRRLVDYSSASNDIGPSMPALWFVLVSPNKVQMLACFHHAAIDATSIALIFREFQQALDDPGSSPSRPQFLPYLNERLLSREPGSFGYWRRLLHGAKPTMLRKSAVNLANNNGDVADILALRIAVPSYQGSRSATLSTLVKTAWAIVLGTMAASEDVVFYHLLNGRDETINGSLDVVGCCVTEVPMRVKLARPSTGRELLEQVQNQILESLPHAHLGADVIARDCSDWANQILYRHSSFVHHNSSKDVTKHFPIGESAYADVQTIVTEDTIVDFSITSTSLGGGAVEVRVEASRQWYDQRELNLLADSVVETMRLLSDNPDRSIGQIMVGLSLLKI
jgi:aryl carrier-like protein